MAVVAIAAGVAAVGAFAGAVSKNKAKKKERKRLRQRKREILAEASPARLKQYVKQYQPQFKELLASGEGAQFLQSVANNLSARGLTGTGVGESLRNAAAGVPAIEAFRRALDLGERTQAQNVSILQGLPFPSSEPRENPFLSALVGGARAYFGGSAGSSATPRTIGDLRTIYPDLIPGNAGTSSMLMYPSSYNVRR